MKTADASSSASSGTTLDRGMGAERWEALAADRRALPARRPARRSPRAAHPQRFAALAETVRDDIRHVSPETEVRLVTRSRPRDPWDFEEVYGACTTSPARYPFDPDARGLPRPHHDRHARRADLPVPADRVAPHPRRACCRPARRRARAARRPGHVPHHRPRPLASTTASPRASPATSSDERSLLKSGIETRNAAFNRSSSGSSASRCARRRRSCCSARPAPASRSWRGASTS